MPIKHPTKELPAIFFHSTIYEEPGKYENNENKNPKLPPLLRNISLEELMDLKVDFAFKQLFGNEKNKDITIVFLNAFLKRTGRDKIVDILSGDKEAGGEYRKDKQSILDLLVITDTSEKINIEIQFTNKYDMVKRSIYYWSGMYRSTLKESMDYEELKPVIAINIMNFDMFAQTDRFYTTYHLYEDEEKYQLTDVMEFHFVEVPKLIKTWYEKNLDPQNDVLVRWLLLLAIVDHRKKKVYKEIYQELEGISMEDNALRKAFENWEELSMTEEEFLAYEARMKVIRDEESAKRAAERRIEEGIREGMKKGLEEGREQGIKQGKKEGKVEGKVEGKREAEKNTKKEIAIRLLHMGISVEVIANSTGLSPENILELKKEIQN
ncbi:Rpn family recombination-promoting nuclease/putative transposase [Virgibacillus oceani]